jgi:hypothetical protein
MTVPLAFVTQCAAVSRWRPLTSVAPQLPSGVCRCACAGQGPVAGVPPTIRAGGRSRCASAGAGSASSNAHAAMIRSRVRRATAAYGA